MRIVQQYLNEELGIKRLAGEENMDYSLLNHWIHKYLDSGEIGLKSKVHPGYHRIAALIEINIGWIVSDKLSS